MSLTTLPTDDFNARLRQRNIDTTTLKKLLIDNNAIIAGGSVLASVIDGTINDLDIYVNLKNAQNFYNGLYKTGLAQYDYSNHLAPPYDKSFLIKNNILSRFNTNLGIISDIMIVSDDVLVESVVENFDLSFCKIWYNGTDILTKHYQDILNRKGTLGNDYLEAYLRGNTFTARRMKKYSKRGFTIVLQNIDTGRIEITRFFKDVISPEMWVVYKLLELLFPMARKPYRSELYFSFNIFCLQKLTQYKNDHRQDTVYTLEGFKYLLDIIYGNKTTDFWTIDMLIYVLLCFTESMALNDRTMYVVSGALCEWMQPKYYDYFESVGIQLTNKADKPAHGLNDFDIPLCDGQVPPFSAGKNGFPDNATREELVDRLKEGITILKLTEDDQKELYHSTYPFLRPPTHAERVAQHQAQVRETAARFSDESSDDDEEVSTEPYVLPNSDKQVPGRCFSIMDAEDINTSSWYPEEDSILFMVEFYPGAEADLVCTNVEVLQKAMNNETGINYKCGSRRGFIAGTQTEVNLDDDLPEGIGIDVAMTDIDYSVEYIPFSYGIDGTTSMNGYLPRNQVEYMLDIVETGRQIRVFTLEFSDTISHTVSKNNTQRGSELADFVSTNHCQAGSAIIVFRVKEFTLAQERSPPALERPNRTAQSSLQTMQRAMRRLWNGNDDPSQEEQDSPNEVAPIIWNDVSSDEEEDDDGPRRLFDGDDSPPPNPFEDDPIEGGVPRRLFDGDEIVEENL